MNRRFQKQKKIKIPKAIKTEVYYSEENILKLINPMFMDELWQEYDRVKTDPVQLDRFHDKISRFKFLDPACGCGNFLIITYRELRILELELLKMKVGTNQLTLDISHLLKVNVEQFYGIEYEDFPCQIAQVGMWLMDHQMNIRAAEQFGMYYARLPLTQSAVHCVIIGFALRTRSVREIYSHCYYKLSATALKLKKVLPLPQKVAPFLQRTRLQNSRRYWIAEL